MGNQFPVKISLSVTQETDQALKKEAKRTNYTVQGLIRNFCTQGLNNTLRSTTLDKYIPEIKSRLTALEEELGELNTSAAAERASAKKKM